ncbi:UNVERIFIED_CONTAM: hypothetical protein GTU68_043652 [Idotea baltica]|nr:hypothetical protein [Idotea baltica]
MAVTDKQCQTALKRLRGFLYAKFPGQSETPEWEALEQRLDDHFPDLFRHLLELYGHHFDFYYHLERLLEAMATMWLERPPELKSVDVMREADPAWFQNGRLIGAMAYVDLFNETLEGVRENIPYLQEMGITYLHLMPLYKSPNGDDDGGYAVSDYREVDPPLGSMEELRELATELRQHGISLCLDFVFNHTSDEHEWAEKAKGGEETFQEYFLMFDSEHEPIEYGQTLREIFPDEHPGCFTKIHSLRKWVWTTFHTYQWDLNYRNPEVFNAMVEEMLFLSNVGVEVLRMDAVPFLWKQKGTSCENLPEAHKIIQAFNAVANIVAPGMIFKSEAIVAPDEITKYIGRDECQVSYNPLMMSLLWEALATRNARLLRTSMEKRFAIDPGCAWVNYLRSHDDIGWGFDNGDAEALGMNPHDHRKFLNDFYIGRHEASFSEGQPFQENPISGDARVTGTTASFCGLQRALAEDDAEKIEMAIERIKLLQGVTFTIGGIPLIYLGDEIATLNDYSYAEDPEKEGDSRWLHRPQFDWERADNRSDSDSPEGAVFQNLLKLTQMRLNNMAIARGDTEIVNLGNDHIFGYFRVHSEQSILCLANFSDQPQAVQAPQLRKFGLKKSLVDIVEGKAVLAAKELEMAPHQFMVLLRQGG